MKSHIELNNVLHHLTEKAQLMRLEIAKQEVPHKPGLYAIFIDSIDDALPLKSPFKEELRERTTNLLYVGKAKRQSLKERLVRQDLSGERGSSTFFRSIGAVLGYKPEYGSLVGKKNKNNYVFTDEDKKIIVNWIDTFIRVRWRETETSALDECEKHLIQNLYPLLNLDHNPRKFKPLEILRQECREIARSEN